MNITEKSPSLIDGGKHTDQRGTLTFLNDFDMSIVKRFYTIENADVEIVRAWRAHRIEQRWFHAIEGMFEIKLIKIDDWENPDPLLPKQTFLLSSKTAQVLHVPAGYASSIQATQAGSRLIVFADYGIEYAKLDDHLYPSDYFTSN